MDLSLIEVKSALKVLEKVTDYLKSKEKKLSEQYAKEFYVDPKDRGII